MRHDSPGGRTADDTLIQWTVNDSQSGAALSLAPTEDMVENAATTLQITLQIADTSGQIADVSVSFDDAVLNTYRIADYRYKADTKELHIFPVGCESFYLTVQQIVMELEQSM